jgi:hypothetical protein
VSFALFFIARSLKDYYAQERALVIQQAVEGATAEAQLHLFEAASAQQRVSDKLLADLKKAAETNASLSGVGVPPT